MQRWHSLIFLVSLVVVLNGHSQSTLDSSIDDRSVSEILFDDTIYALFQEHCISCHGQNVQMGGLDITSRELLFKGGENGSVVIPGNADESLLYQSVAHLNEPHMPFQQDKLADEDIKAVRDWINSGGTYSQTIAENSKEDLWSLQPLGNTSPPNLQTNWVRNSIDWFVLSELYESNMSPSHETDKRTLIRRITYDLHGLPPTPNEVVEFLLDNRSDAYEKLVDRLLASPRYGERWARHWLDVVHYADTHGYDKDKRRPHAWRYRDYVIRAFNEDKPYGRFIQEQLAGDVLDPDDPQGLVSTGFIVAGPWDFVGHVELREGTTDKKITRNLDRDDMLTNTMTTFTSLTVHCSRCHDHKFDPISQKEYYQLQSVFAGVERADVAYDEDAERLQQRIQLNDELDQLKRQKKKADQSIDDATSSSLQIVNSQLNDVSLALKSEELDEGEKESLQEQKESLEQKRYELALDVLGQEFTDTFNQLNQNINDVESKINSLPPAQWVYTAASQFKPNGNFTPPAKPRTVHVLNRGEVLQPKDEVLPAGLASITPINSNFAIANHDDEGQRRLALANWIAHPKNAIVWRSIVNRIWHYHFGKGIVDSPGDFGHMGTKPTHPELLEWLAVQFLQNGQSLKWLHKLIVTSATYRQSSEYNPEYNKIDSANRYLWRMNRQRLDAESVHDFTLAVSGKLDTSMYGPGYDRFDFIDDHSPHYLYDQHNVDDTESYRRSIYRFIVRSVPDPFMQCLDAAEPLQNVHKRNTTITALQALATMNNPFMLRQAEYMAERLTQHSAQLEEQIEWGYLLALNREPNQQEIKAMMDYTIKHGLANTCRLILNLNEFMFID